MYNQELDLINNIRGKVRSRKEDTGINLFLVWGYPTVVVLLLEFAALMLWEENWCPWLWMGIPLVGVPLMIYFVDADYERTHHRTLDESVVMQLWIFIGAACCLGGFTTGFASVYDHCYSTLQSLLIGMGCFLTGVISRFRPMKTCGIIASVLSFACLFFQGDLWPWQLLLSAVITIIALILPGHMMRYYVKMKHEQ